MCILNPLVYLRLPAATLLNCRFGASQQQLSVLFALPGSSLPT